MTSDGEMKLVGPQDPVSKLACVLSGDVEKIGEAYGVSRMDVCVAMSNAIGHILADAANDSGALGPLPRGKAMIRINDLFKVAKAAYDIRSKEGKH